MYEKLIFPFENEACLQDAKLNREDVVRLFTWYLRKTLKVNDQNV